MRAFIHFIILVVAFCGSWILLSQVDFVELLHIKQLTRENERKLGEIVLEAMERGNDELESDTVQACLDSIKHRLCAASAIDDSSITIHGLIKDDVNAFALPNRHLVVYTGLIHYCATPEELSGVIAHEIAHMEQDHVMKKLIKEVGFSMLVTVGGGQSGGKIAREILRLLSSTAFDREQESEADMVAVHMMAKAEIDPVQFADFLFRLSREKNNIPKNFEWLSTHPNSQDRSAEVLRLREKETYHTRPLTDDQTWTAVREIVSSAND